MGATKARPERGGPPGAASRCCLAAAGLSPNRLARLWHDCDGKLALVIGNTELLASRNFPPETVRAMAGEAHHEALRLAAALEELFALLLKRATDATASHSP